MQTEKTSQKRQDIEAQWKWHLEDIYESLEAWEQDFQRVGQMLPTLRAAGDKLGEGKQAVHAAIVQMFDLDRLLSRLFTFARMRRDEDNRDAVYQALVERVNTLRVTAEEAASALRPMMLQLPDACLADCAADPDFADYTVFLQELLRDKPHTLPVEQERLLAMTGELTDAPSTIYDMLTDADMRFPTITDADGQAVELTQGRYRGMISSKDRRVRRESFEAMMGTYAKYGNTFAATYAASVKSDVFEARARRFDGALQASLHPDEVPVAVYDHLIDAIHAAIPTLQRYINLRKPILGLDEVHLYDLYVNMVQDFDLPLTYPEAFDLVLEALAPLGEEYVDKLREARAQGWVDVYESEGKSSGAYSWGVYGVHPFVLLNFEKGIDAASTLAHELGHAMHSDYSNGAQAFPQAEYSLFAAEVASTVNEILLSCHLLRKYPDKAAQAYVMGELMEGFRTTVFRQTLFAEFERESHAMAERGEALTREALSARYLEINRQYYGGCCVMDDAICQEWMRIPHFYRAFYVYKYATGFSAAVTIARRILREGAPAVADYQRFLRAGKSLPPMEALRLAGVDMATEKPVRDAMDWFAQIVEQFEALMQ